MPYVTPEELIDRLGTREATAISDRQKTGSPDLVELASALALAEDEVNSYVGRRYALPLTNSGGQPATIPLSIKRLVIDIARYLDCFTVQCGEQYDTDNEAKIDVSLIAIRKVEE